MPCAISYQGMMQRGSPAVMMSKSQPVLFEQALLILMHKLFDLYEGKTSPSLVYIPSKLIGEHGGLECLCPL